MGAAFGPGSNGGGDGDCQKEDVVCSVEGRLLVAAGLGLSSTPAQANPLRRILTLRSARGIDGACMLVTGEYRHTTSCSGEEGVGLAVNFHIRSGHSSYHMW